MRVWFIYLAAIVLGDKLGTLSVLVYILLGLVGLPVFSGYSGGVGKIAGPTGGYIVGYLPMAFIAGFFAVKWIEKKYMVIIGMVTGTIVLYLLGTVWFVIQMKCDFAYALSVCVIPFLIGDAVKIIVAALLGLTLRTRLKKLGYLG